MIIFPRTLFQAALQSSYSSVTLPASEWSGSTSVLTLLQDKLGVSPLLVDADTLSHLSLNTSVSTLLLINLPYCTGWGIWFLRFISEQKYYSPFTGKWKCSYYFTASTSLVKTSCMAMVGFNWTPLLFRWNAAVFVNVCLVLHCVAQMYCAFHRWDYWGGSEYHGNQKCPIYCDIHGTAAITSEIFKLTRMKVETSCSVLWVYSYPTSYTVNIQTHATWRRDSCLLTSAGDFRVLYTKPACGPIFAPIKWYRCQTSHHIQ